MTRANLRSMHSDLSYGLSIAPKLQRVGSSPLPGYRTNPPLTRALACCCDGVVAATESLLRRSRCCDGDAQTSSVALILRVASRRDALNEEPASFPPGDSNFNSWPTVLGHPPGPVIIQCHGRTPEYTSIYCYYVLELRPRLDTFLFYRSILHAMYNNHNGSY